TGSVIEWALDRTCRNLPRRTRRTLRFNPDEQQDSPSCPPCRPYRRLRSRSRSHPTVHPYRAAGSKTFPVSSMTGDRRHLSPDLFTLQGEVAIVTGGLGRLGSQYTATLARAGASVAVLDKSTRIGSLVKSLLDDQL